MKGAWAYTPSIRSRCPSRLAFSVVAKVRLPPPDSPVTTIDASPRSSRRACIQSSALAQSFKPAGNGCGPSARPELRNSTPTTTQPRAASRPRQRDTVSSAACEIAMPPPCRCSSPGNGPWAPTGRSTYSVMSLPSTPVMVSVRLSIPSGFGTPSSRAPKSRPKASSMAAATARTSSIGERLSTRNGGAVTSSPNGANAAIIRGSDRGSERSSSVASPRRPGSWTLRVGATMPAKLHVGAYSPVSPCGRWEDGQRARPGASEGADQ